jgi:hypothetical protein
MAKHWMDDVRELIDSPRDGRYFVFFGERVRSTSSGVRRFRERFARAGIDVAKIRTIDQLESALQNSYYVEVEDHIAWLTSARDRTPAIEIDLLLAIARGDDAEARRLTSELRTTRQLRSVDGPSEG